jgi:hypothetical protein
VQDGTAEKNIGEALDNFLGYGLTAGSSQDGCAELLRVNGSVLCGDEGTSAGSL